MKYESIFNNAVNFSRSYLWGVSLQGLPSPFNQEFPAVTVSEPRFNVGTKNISVASGEYLIPFGKGAKQLVLTFYDDVKNTLEEYISEWAEEMINEKGEHLPLLDCIKDLSITRYNLDRTVLRKRIYSVIPTGEFVFAGTSENESSIFQVSWPVVGVRK